MGHPIHEANENSPYGNLTKEQFYHKHQISHQETLMINNQNMKIFTQSWQPEAADSNSSRLKGLIAMIHGYTSESSWLFELNAVAMAKAGFFVCALDLQGHGLSEGHPEHITDIQPLVQDCIQYFGSAQADHPNLPHFLYGESLGAAIAILTTLQQKTAAWKGLILAGAMCQVSKKFKPIWPLEKFLPAAAFFAPAWRIAITEPPLRRSYRESWKRKLVEKSPNRKSCGRATAASGLQFLRVCEYIKRKCCGLEVAMLVLHGGDDMICDVDGAKYLYESAASKDKSLKIYQGMWHQWIGEPNERVEEIFKTILSWIEVRAHSLTNTN